MKEQFSTEELEITDKVIRKFPMFIYRDIYKWIDSWNHFVQETKNAKISTILHYVYATTTRETIQLFIENAPDPIGQKIKNLIKDTDTEFIENTKPIEKTWLCLPNPTETEKMLYFRLPKKLRDNGGKIQKLFNLIKHLNFSNEELSKIDSIINKSSHPINRNSLYDYIIEWRRLVDVINCGGWEIEEYDNRLSIRESIQRVIDNVPPDAAKKIQDAVKNADEKFIDDTVTIAKTWLNIKNPTPIQKMLYWRKPKNLGYMQEDFKGCDL